MQGALAGKRILVVEDEYFIATDLQRALKKQGAVPVGPVGDLPGGLSLADEEPLDGALLDVNLEGATCYPIAERLAERSVPFVFLTGYDAWALPGEYRDAPRVSKPFALGAVVDALGRLMPAEAQA